MATHSRLVVIDLTSDWSVSNARTLAAGYHYGLALVPGSGGLVAYRPRCRTRRDTDSNLWTYRGDGWDTVAHAGDLGGMAGDIHQITVANDGLYLTNTHENAVTYLSHDRVVRHDHYIGRSRRDRNHVNSIFPIQDCLLVLLHNEGRRESEILVLGHERTTGFEVRDRLSLWHERCHNIFVDGSTLAYCASADRGLVVADLTQDKIIAEIPFDQHTKGLAVTRDHFIVGLSDFAARADRTTSAGNLAVIDRSSLQVVAQVALSGAASGGAVGNINEIRVLSGDELGFSSPSVRLDSANVRLARRDERAFWARRRRATLRRPIRTMKRTMTRAVRSRQ